MENPQAKPYTLKWFLEEIVRACVVVFIGLLFVIVGNGLMESYLLPDRLKKAEEQMMQKFDEKLKALQHESVERESEFAKIIAELRHSQRQPDIHPDSSGGEDPEKTRLKYLEKHLWNKQQQQQHN